MSIDKMVLSVVQKFSREFYIKDITVIKVITIRRGGERMKFSKITASVIALLIIGGAAAVGVTRAYFSDSENSAGNTIAAGTLDLTVDGGNEAVTTFSLSNQAPGDSGLESTTLNNAGSLGGELDVAASGVEDKACDPDGANDGTEFCDETEDLGDEAETALYLDVDQDGAWSDGDIGLKSDETTYVFGEEQGLEYDEFGSYGGDSWDDVYSGLMSSGDSDDFAAAWRIGSGVGNSIQGDDAGVDISFTLEQAEVD